MRATIATALVAVLTCGALAAESASKPAAADSPAPRVVPHTDTNFTPVRYPTLPLWETQSKALRMQVRVATGLWPEPEKCPLNAKIFGRIDGDGYTIEKVYFESYPGYFVTGNLYRTRVATPMPAQSAPGVLCPHGHWANGRLEQSETGNIPARCIMLARMGCTVFAYDMAGYNDNARHFEHRDARLESPAAQLWGFGHMHLQTWNSVRAIDFLETLPEVDAQRIGVTGASGGGTQTFILSAIDDRVKVACPVNMISHTMQGGCVCENAPCLRINTQNMEIGALFAPKPLLMVSASGDWTKDTPQVEFPFIKSIYTLLGKEALVENAHFDAPHNYNQNSREAMYRFFARHLLGWTKEKVDAIKEHDIPTYKNEQLLVWGDEQPPANLLKWEAIEMQLRGAAEKRIMQSPERIAEIVRAALPALIGVDRQRPASSIAKNQPEVRELELKDRTIRLAYDPKVRPIPKAEIVYASASPGPRSGDTTRIRPELPALPPLPPGGEKPGTGRPGFFTTFNRTPSAELAYEVRTALLNGVRGNIPLALRADGEFGLPALLVRAMQSDLRVKQRQLRTAIDWNRFDDQSDEAYLEHFNIPHIRRLGGAKALAAAACNGPIWFHNVGEHFDEAFIQAAAKAKGVEIRITKEKADDAEIEKWLNDRDAR